MRVGRNRQLVIAVGGELETPFSLGPDAVQSHELSYPLFAYCDTACRKFVPDAQPSLEAADLGVLHQAGYLLFKFERVPRFLCFRHFRFTCLN